MDLARVRLRVGLRLRIRIKENPIRWGRVGFDRANDKLMNTENMRIRK